MAQVRRTQDELGEQSGQRARFEADGTTLALERGVGDPAAPAVEVEDDVAGCGVRLDPRMDERRRWRRGQPIEEREREAGLGPDEGRATRHARKGTLTR